MNIPAKFHGDPITRSGVKRFQSWPSHTRKRAVKKGLKVFDTYKKCMHQAVFQFLFLHLPLGFFHPVFTEMILMASSQRLRKKPKTAILVILAQPCCLNLFIYLFFVKFQIT